MANVRELQVSLVDWEVRAVLKALAAEKARLEQLASGAVGEDEAADAGNDGAEIAILLDRLEEQAKAVFGSQITQFDHKTL